MFKRSHTLGPTLALLAGLGGAVPAFAQAQDTALLKGSAVTAENIVEALTPGAEPIRTRSLRVTATSPLASQSAGAAQAKKPSASLLITFETNSSVLTARSKEQLDVVGAALKNERLNDYRFEVQGHADPRGTAAANLVLSQSRAESVRGYLVATQGLTEARLVAVGKGDTEPLNTRDVAAAENRRVTIVTLAP